MQKSGVQLKSFGIVSLLSTAIILTTSAADWPTWRGPNRDDVCTETGLLKDWPKDGPPLAWKATGFGEGFSTLAIAGDHIFTIGQRGPSTFVVALNVADGSPMWRSEEHTSELQSHSFISYAVFCLKKKNRQNIKYTSLTCGSDTRLVTLKIHT